MYTFQHFWENSQTFEQFVNEQRNDKKEER